MGKNGSPIATRTSKRKRSQILDLSSPRLKKLGSTKRMKIVNKLRKQNASGKMQRVRNKSSTLLRDFIETVCTDYNIDAFIVSKWIDKLKVKYAEPHRFYHNDTNMFSKKLEFLKSSSKYVILATIFQYYEFNSKKICVEQNCSAFMEFYSEAGINDDKLKKIVLKLLGDETIEEIEGFVEEWEYFQDIDLIILGSSDDEYKEYTDLLREEYNTMDLENYNSMRSKEDISNETTLTSINIPKPAEETLTSKLNDQKCSIENAETSDESNDCMIVEIPKAPVICLDEGESFITLDDLKTNNNNNSNENSKNRRISFDSISNISSSILNADYDNSTNTKDLFVIDPKPGFNGSKIPLYHSIHKCAHSTPLRPLIGSEANSTIRHINLTNNTITATVLQNPVINHDSDVILIQDDNDSVVSLNTNHSNNDESVIFCGVQMIRSPERRIVNRRTPSPKKRMKLTPVKKNGFGIHPSKTLTAILPVTQLSTGTLSEISQTSFTSLSSQKRIVIIDGSNVAFSHHNNRKFSAEGIEIVLKYFERKGHETKVVVPQFRLRCQQSTNQTIMHRLQAEDKLIITPSKNLPGKMSSSYDDRFILQLAEEFDGAIISNDNYRDLLAEKPVWKQIIESRVIGYTWFKDLFMVPTDPYGQAGPKLDDILNKKI